MSFRLESWISAGSAVPSSIGEPGQGHVPDRVLNDTEMLQAAALAAAAGGMAAPFGERIVSVTAEHDETGNYIRIQLIPEPAIPPASPDQPFPDQPPPDLQSSGEPAPPDPGA